VTFGGQRPSWDRPLKSPPLIVKGEIHNILVCRSLVLQNSPFSGPSYSSSANSTSDSQSFNLQSCNLHFSQLVRQTIHTVPRLSAVDVSGSVKFHSCYSQTIVSR
jgi:hypothetical protein